MFVFSKMDIKFDIGVEYFSYFNSWKSERLLEVWTASVVGAGVFGSCLRALYRAQGCQCRVMSRIVDDTTPFPWGVLRQSFSKFPAPNSWEQRGAMWSNLIILDSHSTPLPCYISFAVSCHLVHMKEHRFNKILWHGLFEFQNPNLIHFDTNATQVCKSLHKCMRRLPSRRRSVALQDLS